MDVKQQEALVQEFRRTTAQRAFLEECFQDLLAQHELADAYVQSGDSSAHEIKMRAQRGIAKHRLKLEMSRTEDRLAWIEWSDGHASRTNELLAEIRDLLTKMANPPIMVSLESTPESRAAMRAEKLAELEEGCSVTAGSLDDDALYRKVEEMKAHHSGGPVNDGSEAADDRDRALGRAASDAMSDGSEVTCKLIKTPPPSPFDVSLLAVEVATLFEIIRRGPCDYIQPAIKERLRELGFITPLYQRKVSQFAKPICLGEIATHAGRLWALQAGLAEPS